MQQQEWRAIVDFPGYEVSDAGNVRHGSKLLKPQPGRKGYLNVTLHRNGKACKRVIQRLVAAAFIGPRPDGMVVRHRNGIDTDNRSSNLRYGTPVENEADKIEHGTLLYGDKHHQSKLTSEQVAEIRRRYTPRSPVDGLSALAREFNVSANTIHVAIKRTAWSSVEASEGDRTTEKRLTAQEVSEIRLRYVPRCKEGNSARALAAEFGVTAAAIHYIVTKGQRQ